MEYSDKNAGQSWALLNHPSELTMRVYSEIVDNVGFLCTSESDGCGGKTYHYGGTAFFVAYDTETIAHPYLVTAKHNVVKAKERGLLYIRLNLTNGKIGYLQADSAWVFHADEGVDIAVVDLWTVFRESGRINAQGFPARGIVKRGTDTKFATPVGLGDDLFIVGLFTSRIGVRRNLPIVRSGILSCMPDEELQDQDSGFPYHAYLAEVRSLGGLSGSPVYVYRELKPKTPDQREFMLYLLGLIRGHWDYRRTPGFDFDDGELEAVNQGIAIVTPAYELLDLLEYPIFANERRRREVASARYQQTHDSPPSQISDLESNPQCQNLMVIKKQD